MAWMDVKKPDMSQLKLTLAMVALSFADRSGRAIRLVPKGLPRSEQHNVATRRMRRAGLRHVVVDMLPVTAVDTTGLLTLVEIADVLDARGINLNAAGRATEWGLWAKGRGFEGHRIRLFPTLRQAIRDLSGKTEG